MFTGHRIMVPPGQTIQITTVGTLDAQGVPVEAVIDPVELQTGLWFCRVMRSGEITFWRVADEHFCPVN